MKTLFGRKVAIDASMSIYQASLEHGGLALGIYTKLTPRPRLQFLIAVRQQDGQQLMNEHGETTRYITTCRPFH
jgi:flap endonuclease-1